ncbi:MAG: carbohydrate binding domain-containing protein [Bacteroidia bacterium]|nr:carbohydrate binding domain-containing protein [Bacteroidia bacterium]
MSKRILSVLLTFLCSSVQAGDGAGPSGITSVIDNPGFENGLAGWSFSTNPPFTVNVSATYYRTGTKSLKQSSTSTTDLKAYPTSNTITVPAGANYVTVIAYVKASTTNGNVAVGIYNTSTSTETPSATRVTPSTSAWTVVSATFAATSGETYYPILYGKSSNGSTATVHWDDVVIFASNVSTTDLTVPLKGTHPTAGISGTDITLDWDAGSDAETGVGGYLVLRTSGISTATNVNPLSQCNYSATSSLEGPTSIGVWTVVYNEYDTATTFTDAPGSGGIYTYLIFTRDVSGNYITGANATRMYVFSGSNLSGSVAANVSFDGLYLPATDTFKVAASMTATIRAGAEIRVDGYVVEQGNIVNSAGGTVEFKDGSTYRFNRNGSTTAIISPATWSPGSTCLIDGITTTAPNGLNQTFFNLIWNCASQNVNVTFPSSGFRVDGDFTIQSTASRKITLRNSTFKGHVFLTGGTVDCSSGTTITLSGTEAQVFAITGPAFSLNLNNAAGATLGQNLTVNTNLTLTSGTLRDSSFTLTMASLAKITKLQGELNEAPTFAGSVDLTYNETVTTGFEVPSGTVRNLVINASGGTITLNSHLTMTGTLTLTSGIIASSAVNVLTMNAGSSVSGVSNSSYVDGPVKKVGNTSFTFPVGDNGNYQPIAITAPAVATDAFTASYSASDPSALYDSSLKAVSIDHVSLAEFWDLSRDAGTSNVRVTLTFDGQSGGITNLNDLVVAHWTGGLWVNEGRFATTGTTTAGTIQSNTVSTFSPFTLASINSGSNPLPVELSVFEGTCTENGVVLHWETASEQNNDFFDVERSSDTDTYLPLARIYGAGNSTTLRAYQYEDLSPEQGAAYYRLKQTDYNGHSTFFGPVYVNCPSADEALPEIFFNEQEQLVVYHFQPENTYQLSVYDITGRLLHAEPVTLRQGRNEFDLIRRLNTGSCSIVKLSDLKNTHTVSKLMPTFHP